MRADLRIVALWIAALGVMVVGSGRASFAADHNKCGCYRTDAGSCACEKKARCGCPGECEPKGCEEKRQKQIDKEIADETKRARQAGGGSKKAAVQEKASAAKDLTGAQKKELARLLQAYANAHPEETDKRIGEVARELGRGDK